jgi:hypothetical protein
MALLGLFLILLAVPAQAQTPPPTILAFGSSLANVTLAEAESESTPILFSWNVIGLRPGDRLGLEVLRLNQWLPVAGAEVALGAPSGTYEAVLQPSLTFAPPTYRLVIYDASNALLDQHILNLPYLVILDVTTRITSFSTAPANSPLTSIDIPVVWAVENRQPTQQLVFEQVFADGSTVSVEKPRPNLWIPSFGQGVVSIQPAQGNPIRLRLSVRDLTTNAELDRLELQVEIEEAIASVSSPTPRPTRAPNSVNSVPVRPVVISFIGDATQPLNYGQTVRLRWEVQAAQEISLYVALGYNPGQIIATSLPASGTFDYTLPAPGQGDPVYARAVFSLVADPNPDDPALPTQWAVTLNCPIPFFFGPTPSWDELLNCPSLAAQSIPVVIQAFERGRMLWFSDTRQITVLYNDGRFESFPDTYSEADNLALPIPPPGLSVPQRGFGKLWNENTAVQQGLGWATGAELSYTSLYQTTGHWKTTHTFMSLPDGPTLHLLAQGTAQWLGSWDYVQR